MLFDFAALTPQDTYKLLVSTVTPRPIAWVVTRSTDGKPNAAPFSFFNVLSGNPPIISVGIGGRGPGRLKDTAVNIAASGEFTVCLVPYAQAEAMNVTAIDFGPEVDEIAEAGLTTAPSAKIAPPRIAESPVALECTLFQTIDLGSGQSIVLGRVVAMHIRDDCVLDPAKAYVDTPKLDLVGRLHGRGWYARTTDRFEIPRITPAEWAARKAAGE
jgi:flavin reductase (DIM6/NTAB) family NADH-FMN oxidoreductase RutF